MAAASSSSPPPMPSGESVVSKTELRQILEAIRDPSVPLNEASRKFQAAFTEKGRFRGCCALVILLRDFLLTLPQRLAVYFLLFDAYRHNQSGVNPFVPVFISALRAGPGISLSERRFAQQLLLAPRSDKTAGASTPSDLAESLAKQQPASKTPDLTVVMREFELSVPQPPTLRQAERGPVVVDPSGTTAKTRGRRAVAEALQAQPASSQRDGAPAAEALATSPAEPIGLEGLPAIQPSSVAASLRLPVAAGEVARLRGTEGGASSLASVSALLAELDAEEAKEEGSAPAAGTRGGLAAVPPALRAAAALDGASLSLGASGDADGWGDTGALFGLAGFRPVFSRPPPALVADAAAELVWLGPSPEVPLLWETRMCSSGSGPEDLRALMNKAISPGLDAPEASRLKALLSNHPQAVFESGLTPAKLPALVQQSPVIAVHCLGLLRDSAQIDDFLSALVRMEMSLPSMEVVNAVSLEAKLPKHFLHLYISNCITTCEGLTDRFMQSRLVRLVCVFLQSLIRGNVIDVRELFVEVKAFCISFSTIKEANALYKMIKKFDEEEGQ